MSRRYRLDEAEMSLLNKGLTFIPSWKTNNFLKPNLRIDLEKYHKKIKLLAYFEKRNKKSKMTGDRIVEVQVSKPRQMSLI